MRSYPVLLSVLLVAVSLPVLVVAAPKAPAVKVSGALQDKSPAAKKNLQRVEGLPVQASIEASAVWITPVAGERLISMSGWEKLEPGYLYLRRKLDAKRYAFFKGRPKAEAFGRLYALDLNGQNTANLLQSKMYRSKLKKAFEDEQDIYFSTDGLYFESTRELYAQVEGAWVEFGMKPQKAGGLEFVTHPEKASVYYGLDSLIGVSPFVSGVFEPGMHLFRARRDGYYPSILPIAVKAGEQNQVQFDLVAEMLPPTKPIQQTWPRWSADSSHEYFYQQGELIRNALTETYTVLEALEADFAKSYYSLAPAPQDSSWKSVYQNYRTAYDAEKNKAFQSYAADWLAKIRSLENVQREWSTEYAAKKARSLTLSLGIVNWKVKQDTVPGLYQVELEAQDPLGSVHAWWKGSVRGVGSLNSSEQMKIQVKAVDDAVGLAANRFQLYQLSEPKLMGNGTTWSMAGRWQFEPEMMQVERVARFANADSMAAVDARNLAIEEAKKLQQDSLANVEKSRLAKDQLVRGAVVELDGGDYVFKHRKVVLSPFGIQATEVTQEHFERVTGKNPSSYKGAQLPVHNVSWEVAMDFCAQVGGNLPTEAQWEMAARGGTLTYYFWGDRQTAGKGLSPEPWANYDENSNEKEGPKAVGSKRANPYGLVDVAGNVREWVRDGDAPFWYFNFFRGTKDPIGPSGFVADYRVMKGGGWRDGKQLMEHTKFDSEHPLYWDDNLGFRCAFPAGQKPSLQELEQKLAKFATLQPKKK